MRTQKLTKFTFLILLLGLWSCEVFDPGHLDDPNNPSVDEVLTNANKAQLQNLVSGLEIRHRGSTIGFVNVIGTFGREIYPMRASDPRNMRDLLGLAEGANAETDPSFRGGGTVWNSPYATIKQASTLMIAAQNTGVVNEQQKNGYLGFAKTIKAFQYLIPLLTQSKANGIRIDVDDPQNPGPFLPFDQAMARIRALLNEAQTDLSNAGSSFHFTLTDGFASFNTPATFIKLNRAIDARAAMFAEDWPGALQSLEDAKPFFQLDPGREVMYKGANFVYTGPPDAFNPFYYPENAETNQIEMVHPSMITDAEAGDQRVVNKFFKRDNPLTQQGLTAEYQDIRYESNMSPVPWLRNEELILIYAEAKAQTNKPSEAVDAINLVRNTWGLPDFNSADKDTIIDQILYERRYSLWYEFGTRWFDAKRYDKLNLLPTDGGKIFKFYARPLSEVNWDNFNS